MGLWHLTDSEARKFNALLREDGYKPPKVGYCVKLDSGKNEICRDARGYYLLVEDRGEIDQMIRALRGGGAREGGLLDITERARKIVRLAASTKSSAQHWLKFDEYGTWERRAAELLKSTAEKVVELGLTPGQVDEEIAIQLRVEALQAMLSDAKKKKGRR